MMLRDLTPLLRVLLLPLTGQGQTMADVMNNRTDITWVGLDFTAATFTPAMDFIEVQNNVDLALARWNALLEQEPAKFDLGTALGSTRTKNNTTIMQVVNAGLSPHDLIQGSARPLDAAKIPGMVAGYKTEGEGVGVVFIVELFDKTAVQSIFHVTFFNMATKEVLHTERMVSKPGGFGLRNYWAGGVSNVLKAIKSDYAKMWKKRFK